MKNQNYTIGHYAGSNCWSATESAMDIIQFAKDAIGFDAGEFEEEDAIEVSEEAIDALNYEGNTPPFTYWQWYDNELHLAPDIESAQMELPSFGTYRDEMPDDFTGEACVVNDHGNIDCGYYVGGSLATLYWDCV